MGLTNIHCLLHLAGVDSDPKLCQSNLIHIIPLPLFPSSQSKPPPSNSNIPYEVPTATPSGAWLFSLSALLLRLSSKLFLLSANNFICLPSTPVNQYPKLPPTAAKNGYAHRDSLLKKGRISIPSCQRRTATPRKPQLLALESICEYNFGGGYTEAAPE